MLRDDPEQLNLVLREARKEREARQKFWVRYLSEFLGPDWRQGIGTKRTSNYVYAYAETMMAVLAFEHPTWRFKAKYSDMAVAVADSLTTATDNSLRENKYIEELGRIVFDSLYAIGIGKLGLQPGDSSLIDVGTINGDEEEWSSLLPFMTRVSPFRFLWDDTAESIDRCQFYAHEFDRDIESLIEDPRYTFDAGVADSIRSSRGAGKLDRDERGVTWQKDLVDKMPAAAELVEVWLRSQKRIVTLVRTGEDSWSRIRSAPYVGPRTGPYRFLYYSESGTSPFPVAPAVSWWRQWIDLEKQERVMMHQVENEKTVVAFKGGSKDSAKLLQEAQKHSIVTGMEDTGKEVTYGGITAERHLAVGEARQRFEHSSGMSDIRRGMPSRTEQTATAVTIQDRYANIRTEYQSNRVVDFTSQVIEDFAWYHWNDPSVVAMTFIKDPESGERMAMMMQGGLHTDPETGAPDDGLGLTSFYVQIDRDSLRRRNGPMERMQAIEDAGFMLGPVAQIAMMQGFMVDVPSILKRTGERIGWENLETSLVPMTPMAQFMLVMSQTKFSTPAGDKNMQNAGGQKGAMNQIPGGFQGMLMRNVMGGGSETMNQAGKMASPMGQMMTRGG